VSLESSQLLLEKLHYEGFAILQKLHYEGFAVLVYKKL